MNEETREIAQQTGTSPEEVRAALHLDLANFNQRFVSRQSPPVSPPAAPEFAETTQTFKANPITATSVTPGNPPLAVESTIDLWIAEDAELHSYAVHATDQGVITP